MESVAVKNQWVKEGDLVEVVTTGTGEVEEVTAMSDPYYDNEERADVINVAGGLGYAKWNVARSRWEF